MTIQELLASYPRQRPRLPEEQARDFEQTYLNNREGKGFFNKLSQATEAWMHKEVGKTGNGNILELGAGTLNHLQYENGNSGNAYDIVEPREFLYKSSNRIKDVSDIYSDITGINPENRYSKIISIATLEHVCDLPRLIAHSGMLLNADGLFCNAIPSEGSFLWGLSWRISTGLAYKIRTGYSYRNIMRHEHVNDCMEIICLIKHFFKDISIKRFPLPLFHLSIYSLVLARDPDIDRCRAFLKQDA
jgi:hypothetical protein